MNAYIKYLTIIFLSFGCFFLFQFHVNAAKTVNDVACNYKVMCKATNISGTVELTDLQIQVNGYNDNNNGAGFSSSNPPSGFGAYIIPAGGSNLVSTTINKKTKDYKNYETIKKQMIIMNGDPDGFNFAYLYSQQDSCPTIYCNYGAGDTFYIELVDLYQNFNTEYNVNNISSSSELLKNTLDNKWLSRENFYKDNTGTTPKSDKICKYENVEFLGEYYGGEKQNTGTISFITHYSASTGNAISYEIEVDGSKPITPITSLDEDAMFMFASYKLEIASAQLKQYFKEGDCIDKSKVIPYLSDLFAGVYTYTLTTDKNEVDSNVIDEDFDDGKVTDGKTEELEIIVCSKYDKNSQEYKDCAQRLKNGGEVTCDDIFGAEGNRNGLYEVIHTITIAIRILTPIIFILLSMLDFTKATADDGQMPKAKKQFVIRGIIAVVIFLLPSLINLIFQILGKSSCMI